VKLFYKRPQQHIMVVKPDRDSTDYEIFIMTPVKLGEASKIGTQRIVTDDNHTFTNIAGAAKYLAERGGHAEVVSELGPYMRKPTNKLQVAGMDLVATQKWVEFCNLRKMDARDQKAVGKTYTLNQAEMEALGLATDSSLSPG